MLINISVTFQGLFPELFKHKAGEIGYVIMLGLHTGFWGTFVSVVSRGQIGDDGLARSRGYLMTTLAIGLFAGSPLAGWLCDREGNFEIAFYLAGEGRDITSYNLSDWHRYWNMSHSVIPLQMRTLRHF